MSRKYFIVVLLFSNIFLLYTGAKAQNQGYNKTEIVEVSGATTEAQVDALTNAQKQTLRIYLDGFSRSLQAVTEKTSPLQNDMIQPIAYDNLGRETIKYLAYAGKSSDQTGSYRTNAISTDQPAYYNQTTQHLIVTDASPYSQQVFESSPAQRLLSAGMVGTGFQPVSGQHYKTINYRSNNTTSDGNILIWNPDGTFTAGNYYANNILSVVDGKDEDNVETLSFADITGHTVLKRQILAAGNLDTYYVYDNAGFLIYTIPPGATAILAANTYNLASTALSHLIFAFTYDNMGRVVQKTVPGSGIIYIVYDPANRPVLMQDANLRASNSWYYIKYDYDNRSISHGIYVDATNNTRALMQTYVSGLSYGSTWSESRSSAAATGYYTNVLFPTVNITPLLYAYYDDYDLTQAGTSYFNYVSQGISGEEVATTAMVVGLPTMVRTRSVGAGLANIWLTKAMFYDRNLHMIQVQQNNHLYYTDLVMTDFQTTAPDFVGTPITVLAVKKTAATTTLTVKTVIAYDQAHRLNKIDQTYNGGSTVYRIATYAYNESGQLISKQLGSTNAGASWLQQLDLRYNIRAQLTYINNSKLSNDGGVTNGDANDVFGMQLLYSDATDANLGNTPSYTGRLAAIKWMSRDGANTSSNERSFLYSYDGVNRYTGETYKERATAGTGAFTATNGWNEAITYENNGNIKTIQRNSATQNFGTATQIDNLAYTYSTTNPNQLATITDGTTSQYTGAGFRNLTGSTGSYVYDNNGNMTSDPYKGLTIAYNVINHTDKITVTTGVNRFINYTYDAAGSLIRKQQYDNNVLQNTTDYLDGYVYVNNNLQYFKMPEGRVNNTGTGGTVTLNPEYVLTDPQGNARVSFDNTGTSGTVKVRQENSYYGFGLIMPNSPVATPTNDNKHLYNEGSEWQNDYGDNPNYYQTAFRNYDAAVGRFVAVDPMAGRSESMSSYQYAGNNPILYNDPLGNFYTPWDYNSPGYSDIQQQMMRDAAGHGPHHAKNYDDLDQMFNDPSQSLLARAQAGDPEAVMEYARTYGTTVNVNNGNVLDMAYAALMTLLNKTVADAEFVQGFYQLTWAGQATGISAIADAGAYDLYYTATSTGCSYDIAISQNQAQEDLDNLRDLFNDKAGFSEYFGASLNILGGLAEIGVAYLSGGLLGTTFGVDGLSRIVNNTIKIATYATQGKAAGDNAPTNLGGFLGEVITGRTGSDLQKTLETGDNLTMLFLSGGPLVSLSEAGEALEFGSMSEKIIKGTAAASDMRDYIEEVHKIGEDK